MYVLSFYGIKATVGSGCVIAMHFCYTSCYFSCQHYHHQKQQTKQKTNAHFFLPVLYPCWSLVCFVASQQHRKIKPTAFLTLGFISCNGNFSVFFFFLFFISCICWLCNCIGSYRVYHHHDDGAAADDDFDAKDVATDGRFPYSACFSFILHFTALPGFFTILFVIYFL